MITSEFLMAGRAIFTIEVPAEIQERTGCNPHYTYKVTVKPGNDRFPQDAVFVSMLSGPDNQSDYSYLGMIRRGKLVATRASKLGESYAFKLASRAIQRILSDEAEAIAEAGFDVHHEGKCGRCGKPLTVPESIQTGLGPICVSKAVA